MLRPNTTGYWTRRDGYNSFGEPLWAGPFKIGCAVVSLAPRLKPTPIRTDASASHAGSDEITSYSTVLVPAKYAVKIGDKFAMDGMEFRIVGVDPQRRVGTGKIDHFEVTLEAWQINAN